MSEFPTLCLSNIEAAILEKVQNVTLVVSQELETRAVEFANRTTQPDWLTRRELTMPAQKLTITIVVDPTFEPTEWHLQLGPHGEEEEG